MRKIILILVIVVFALVSGSYFYLGIAESRGKGWFVKKGTVQGSALVANGLEYTFNYEQQEGVLNEINNSKKASKPPRSSYTSGAIESIILYLFNEEKPLVLFPESDDFSFFKVENEPFYIQLEEPKDLEIILELAYDK